MRLDDALVAAVWRAHGRRHSVANKHCVYLFVLHLNCCIHASWPGLLMVVVVVSRSLLHFQDVAPQRYGQPSAVAHELPRWSYFLLSVPADLHVESLRGQEVMAPLQSPL